MKKLTKGHTSLPAWHKEYFCKGGESVSIAVTAHHRVSWLCKARMPNWQWQGIRQSAKMLAWRTWTHTYTQWAVSTSGLPSQRGKERTQFLCGNQSSDSWEKLSSSKWMLMNVTQWIVSDFSIQLSQNRKITAIKCDSLCPSASFK